MNTHYGSAVRGTRLPGLSSHGEPWLATNSVVGFYLPPSSPGARATPRNASPARAERIVTNLSRSTVRCWLGGADAIGDFHQFVGIGAVVAVLADRGRDCVNCGGAVVIDDADHVAASAGRGLDRRGIVRNAIGHAEVESILDDVLAHPVGCHSRWW